MIDQDEDEDDMDMGRREESRDEYDGEDGGGEGQPDDQGYININDIPMEEGA